MPPRYLADALGAAAGEGAIISGHMWRWLLAMVVVLVSGCRPGAASSPAAAPTSARSSAIGGVGTRSLTFVDPKRAGSAKGRTIVTEVYYPAAASGADVPPASGGPFPIVLFSHGLRGLPGDYKGLWQPWVQAGMVVVAPVYPMTSRGAPEITPGDLVNQPADASFALDEVLKQTELHGVLNGERVVAVGHSEGALTTYGLFTSCCRDARLKGGIILAGDAVGFERDSFAPPLVPLLFIHGDADPLVPIALGRAAFGRVPWPKAFITLQGGAHVPPYLGGSNPAAAVVSASTADFLRWVLLGQADALVDLRRDANVLGVAGIDDHL